MTIRDRLEAIRDRHAPRGSTSERWCWHCGCISPCPDLVDAEDALESLESAELISEYRSGEATEKSHWRYVPDVETSS